MNGYLIRVAFSVACARGSAQAPVRFLSRYPRRSSPKPVKSAPTVEDAWTEVKDAATGQTYWWNTVTNQTTQLGAPKPDSATAVTTPPPPTQEQGPGLGRVVAEGFAFGTGSAIAHSVVGSIFGGFGGGGHDDDSVDL